MADPVTPVATADLVDEYGESRASIPVQFRSFVQHRRFAGPAVTVRCFEDNALLKQVLSEHPDPAGSVLVVDGGGSLRSALMGDLIAAIAVERGWAGAVLHGCIRDSVAIDAMPFGVKAIGTNPRKSSKDGAGASQVSIEIGGVTIQPGQIVHSDEDGVVVLPL